MKILYCIFAVLLILPISSWSQDYGDHRNVQFSTRGTDFWVCFPPMQYGGTDVTYVLMPVPEHDCDVTVSNERIGFILTQHVYSHRTVNRRIDTLNAIQISSQMASYQSEISHPHLAHDEDLSGSPAAGPQNKGFHVTSTDTIALYLMIFSSGTSDAVNILPTDLLRDDYVVETFPVNRHYSSSDMDISGFDVVATEDNTVVDIVLSDWDWVNRHPGDTVTVTLNRGQLYHVGCGDLAEKYYPFLFPYNPVGPSDTPYPPFATLSSHSFLGNQISVDTCLVDLSGSRVTARDNKRIAVFESNPYLDFPDTATHADCAIDQALPLRFSGQGFVVPNLIDSRGDFLRLVGLHDNTTVTITDPSRQSDRTRTLTLNAFKADWFKMDSVEGPFYITSDYPIILKDYAQCNGVDRFDINHYGDPAKTTILPIDWWHSGNVDHYTMHWTDSEQNRWTFDYHLHIIARNEDVSNILVDDYPVEQYFQNLVGTPYSYAYINNRSSLNSVGMHHISTIEPAFFTAMMEASGPQIHAVWNLSPRQPGGTYLYVNDVCADSLSPDSIWCMYDTIHFHGWSERPADSILWDFGDGNSLAFAYDDGQYVSYRYHDTGQFTVRRIVTFRDEDHEGCAFCNSAFNRAPDTLNTHIRVHNHHDSAFAVRLCEGSYTFRGYQLDHTDTFYITTYWTPSGCDTLWQIDLVTCPHCSWDSDTISPDQLPWSYNGYTFNTESLHYPVHLDIDDVCDSIIDYYLVVIPHWGEEPLDSIFVLAPNIFTPNSATNNRFRVVGNQFIRQMEVSVFNRFGMQVAHFDGLTQDWDGTHNGVPCPNGTYAYYIRYIDTEISNWQTLYGTVTLVR